MNQKRFPRLLTLGLAILFVIFVYLWQAKQSREINLIIASTHGNIDEVIFRSKVINDLNYVSFKGDTPLNAASKNGHLEIVKYLVENGAQINMVDVYGNTARMAALNGGHAAIVEYFDEISD